jgi:hypothetical protein
MNRTTGNTFTLNKILPRLAGAKFFMASFAAGALLLSSCDKDSEIGLGVQPEGDLLKALITDTVSITTFSVKEDSIKTDDLPSGTAALGSYNDPVFGMTQASIYSQFLLPTNLTDGFGTGLSLDSIVLSVAYEGINPFYGTVNDGDMQTVKVYQLTESLSKDASYYSNQTLEIYPFPLGSATFNPKPVDQVVVGTDTVKAQLRIKLEKGFGEQILNAGASNLSSNTAFLNFFKGLHIRPETAGQAPGEGAILYFNLLDAESGLTLYYKVNGVTQNPYRLVVNSSAARYEHFTHTYPVGGPIKNQLSNPALGQQLSYLQSLGGLKTKVKFPYLAGYRDSGVVINRAELVVKADPSYITSAYPAPEKLFVVPVTSTGANGDLLSWPDFGEGANYYGGSYDAIAKEYRFNITRYAQGVITGSVTDYGLYLTVAGSAVSASRLVIGGGDNPTHGMELRLTYTKLK